MANKKFSIVIIDYKSIERTLLYIKEFCQYCSDCDNINFVIIDNFEKRQENEIIEWYNTSDKLMFHLNDNKVISVYYRNSSISLYVLNVGENIGYARGNNLGAVFSKKVLGATYTIFSNNDIRFFDIFSLKTFESDFIQNSSYFAIGPTVIGLNGEIQSPANLLEFWEGIVFPYSFLKKILKTKKTNDFFLSGCFFVVDLKKFFDVGMFDEHTFLYWEEAILKERGKRCKYMAYHESDITIIHEGGRTTQANNSSLRLIILYFESAYYYFKSYKNISRWALCLAKVNFYGFYVPLYKLRSKLKRYSSN